MRYPDCNAALSALSAGLDTPSCHDFRAVREVVMCDAWHGESGPITPSSFAERIKESWAKVHATCATHGGTTPETGFLEPQPVLPEPSQIQEIRRDGTTEGLLVMTPDGEVTACVTDTREATRSCRTVPGGESALTAMRSILEAQGYEVV